MELSSLNGLAIIIAAVSSFILGGLWYSPMLFGSAWMQQVGLDEQTIKNQSMSKIFILAFIASLIASLTLAVLIGKTTPAEGGTMGLLLGLGIAATSFAINDLFERRSFKLYAINASYHVAALTIMGIILAGLS